MARLLPIAMLVLAASVTAAAAQMHDHGNKTAACNEPALACATKVTPGFAPDGTLWLAFTAAGRVMVAKSTDLGRTFAPPATVNVEPLNLDWGPDARPKIVIDRDGRVVVAFARFKDREFNGQVLHSVSSDGGRTFARPRPVTDDKESQRFEALALDADGAVFTAWLDKRNRAAARERKEKFTGAALAFAWSNDHGATMSDVRIAQDHTCECCRLGVAFAAPGRPVVLFRNIFSGSVRDHAVVTFANRQTPGPVQRVSIDDWKTEACPHHGPSLAVAPDGAYHVAWFTNGRARRGLFYARSSDGGATFSAPMRFGRTDRAAAHPYLLAVDGAAWLVWKEFDGETTSLLAMVARHNGGWSEPRLVATTRDTSDHPLLVAHRQGVFASWQTKADGYRLLALEHTQ